jgi:hypothetical protein
MRRMAFPVWILSVALLVLGFVSIAAAQAPPDIYYNDLEFADMQSTNLGGTPKLAAGEMANQPAGKVEFTNGSGLGTGFLRYLSPLALVTDPGNCHSGTKCLRADIGAGQSSSTGLDPNVETGYLNGKYPTGFGCASYGGNCIQNYFVRVWMRYASNFVFNPLPPDTSCQGKMMYLRNTGWPTGANTIFLVYTASAGALNVGWENQNPGTDVRSGTFPFPIDNAWHELEVQADIANSRARIWLDGNLKIDFAAPMSALVPSIDYVTFGMYVNNLGNGGCISPNSTKFWVDDMAISTTRIGGGGGATTPPAPSGLKVIIN